LLLLLLAVANPKQALLGSIVVGLGTPFYYLIFRDRLRSPRLGILTMTWIKTVPISETDDKLAGAMEAQRQLYPVEYAQPVHPTAAGEGAEIVASHSLIPEALHHAFATFGVLMSPDLPLSRRQHEMITTVVSVTNRCHY
jgi:hypothetical protein